MTNQHNDKAFQDIHTASSKLFKTMTSSKLGRVFHKQSTTLSGTLHCLTNPAIPANDFFISGQKYAVIVRHANGVQDDDAAIDNRGATIRMLNSLDLSQLMHPKFDLLLTTGECFMLNTAKAFSDWTNATRKEREQIVKSQPEVGKVAWSNFRLAQSYTTLYYYSKIAYVFVGQSGEKQLAKFRLIPMLRSPEDGWVLVTDILPPDMTQRDPQDQRAPNFLHEDLQQKLNTGPIQYLLQIQFHPISPSNEELEYDTALDCLQAWPASAFPWHDLATLELEHTIDNKHIEPLEFNITHSPANIFIPEAHSVYSFASLAQLRSSVYREVAAHRTKAMNIHADNTPPSPISKKIVVLGGGPAGLFSAYTLTKLGHQVTVLERSANIGGKARSLEYDGHLFNLGAHVCTSEYTAFRKLVEELDLEISLDSAPHYYDMETHSPTLFSYKLPNFWKELKNYDSIKQTSASYLPPADFKAVNPLLLVSAKQWLTEHEFSTINEFLGVIYTASGYGYLDDDAISALYFIRFLESLGLEEPLSLNWTPKLGFSAVWDKLCKKLPDVRTNVKISNIQRKDGKIHLYTADHSESFDELIIACPYQSALSVLNATEEEQSLFKNIQHLDYYTTLCRIENLPKNGFYFIKQYCQNSSYIGHTISFLHRFSDSNVYSLYAYGNASIQQEEIENYLRQDIKNMGGELKAILHQEKWLYFPHVNSEALQAGFYQKLSDLQGKNNTYYIGSIQNFEAIECNLKFITQLIETHFQKPSKPSTVIPGLSETLEDKIQCIQTLLAEKLELGSLLPGPDTELFSLGLDSVKAVDIFQSLSSTFALELEPSVFFDYPTITALAQHIQEKKMLIPA